MKKITQLLIFLFVCMDMSAQNMLYEEIQGAKDAKIKFEKMSPIFCETDRNAVLSGGYNRVSVQGLQRGYHVVRIRYGDTVLTKPLMVE